MRKAKVMFVCCLLFVVCCFAAVQVMAETAAINPTDDVSMRYDGPLFGTGGGAGDILHTGGYYGWIYTYLKFDLSSIAAPAGYIIHVNSATLDMYAASESDGYAGPNPFDDSLFAASSNAWDEVTLTPENAPLRGDILDTWTYVEWTTNQADGAALTSFVQSQVDSVDKKASFIVGASDPNHEHNDHHYYGTAGLSGAIALNLEYSFVEDPLDFYPDGEIDMKDLELFVQDWLRCVDPNGAGCETPWQE